MSAFEEDFRALLPIEGGSVDNPNDSGGATRWGVTEATAREWGYKGAMADLPEDVAQQIAKAKFWDVMRLDEVAALSRAIARRMLQFGYHAGPAAPAKALQRSLNTLNHEGRDYADLKVDNVLGMSTLAALRAYLLKRSKPGELVLQRMLASLQCAFYVQLCEEREKDEEFIYGWVLNRIVIQGDAQ